MVTSPLSPRARTSSRPVVPVSTSTDWPGCTSVAATRAMARFASTFTLTRRSWIDTVRVRESETAPPWVRRNLPSRARASRSARAVTRDTPRASATSATCTDEFLSSIERIAARLSSANSLMRSSLRGCGIDLPGISIPRGIELPGKSIPPRVCAKCVSFSLSKRKISQAYFLLFCVLESSGHPPGGLQALVACGRFSLLTCGDTHLKQRPRAGTIQSRCR